MKWDRSLIMQSPFPKDKIDLYLDGDRCITGYRELSDLIRLAVLYRYGGSYIDTDDLCIKPIPVEENIICRSYDPHTAHYNLVTPEDCIPGVYREIRGYDHINFFPRNDCWLNFVPKHPLIRDILSNPKLNGINKPVYIGDGFSWQSLTLEACMKYIMHINDIFRTSLTLLYLFEDFVSASSFWDRCHHGGEMCDLYNEIFPDLKEYEWGFYKCTKDVAERFLETVIDKYPHLSHMWLHRKDENPEWMLEDLDAEGKYAVSTWIYKIQKDKIKSYI
jgi:hypothetical protein